MVAIIGILASLAIPSFLRARKRSTATVILEEVKVLDHAIERYAADNRKSGSAILSDADLAKIKEYLKKDTDLYNNIPNDRLGNAIVLKDFQTPPQISLATFTELEEVAPTEFWAGYGPTP